MKALKEFAKKIPGLSFLYRGLRKKYISFKLKNSNTERIFTDICRSNKWGGEDSISGAGSDLYQTRIIRKELPVLFGVLNISTVLDVPCGDFHWMSKLNIKGVNYTGGDIVEELIRKNREKYERANVHFEHLNLINDKLPKADLVLCRDCFVHFSFKEIFTDLQNICNSEPKFLLTTTFTDRKDNHDILTGQWRTLNLQVAPFGLPEPLEIINEECTKGNGFYRDKSLGLWKIEDVRQTLTARRT